MFERATMESDSFIFDDDIEEIGSDVEAFCPKCKADTAHTIITKYEDEIRRVQCSPCGDVHAYRKPRGDLEEEGVAESERPGSKKKIQKKPTWEEFFARHDASQGRPYSFRDSYIENDIVTHPKFGLGFTSETMDEDKVEITFKDGRRVLVHNRKELPGAPPELARAPKPRPVPEKKGAKGKGKAAEAKSRSGKMPEPPKGKVPEVAKGKSLEVARGKAAKVAVEAAKGKPAEAAKGKPAEAAKGKPAEAAKGKPAEAAKGKPVKATQAKGKPEPRREAVATARAKLAKPAAAKSAKARPSAARPGDKAKTVKARTAAKKARPAKPSQKKK
jgi:hypothetical protein